ncbi:MAG: HD domain-containing protein [Planctomycetes bacterium]|nr:HD domain-containing protein [Planctomycetota bacterium]
MDKLVTRAAAAVRRAMEGEGSGHDWWHVSRVWRMAERLARTEPKADRRVVALGALLHDLGDWKFHGGDEEAAPREAGRLLRKLGAEAATIARVQQVCREVSFKGAGVADRPTSLETRIVQDADRLDAIGAIGVARTFAYGGAKGRSIYDPDEKPVLHRTFAAYKKSRGHTINHFYEKLLLLKDRLHTREARRIARHRHAFLVAFLKRFNREWNGDA